MSFKKRAKKDLGAVLGIVGKEMELNHPHRNQTIVALMNGRGWNLTTSNLPSTAQGLGFTVVGDVVLMEPPPIRFLTKNEVAILRSCKSKVLALKAAVCLMLGREGGVEVMYPRQLVGTGVKRSASVGGSIYTEEQVLLCGCGLSEWWAKVVWVACKDSK